MSRDEVVAALADEIVQGVNRVPLSTVIDAVLDEPLISNDDAAMLIANFDMRSDILDRAEKCAYGVVVTWLLHSPRGTALVAERIEREEAEEAQGERSAA